MRNCKFGRLLLSIQGRQERRVIFFNKRKKAAAKIFNRAGEATTEILKVEDGNGVSLKEEFGAQIGTGKWSFYVTIAGVFLGFQAKEAGLSETDSRELAQFERDLLQQWNKDAPESFYDLADFIITSRDKVVDSASASGLWVLLKITEEMPAHEDMDMAHKIGNLLNRAVV